MTPPQTLIGIFLSNLERHAKPDVFMRKGANGWESIPHTRARADVESLALALAELGVVRGDRVALLSENRYEWPVSDLAILALGAITVPIYPTLTAQQVRHVLANSEAKAIVVSNAGQLEKVRAIGPSLPALAAVVRLDSGTPEPRTGEHAFAALLERGAAARARDPQAFAARAAAVKADEVATIIYTSGTTGEPKGAMLTHGNVVSNVRACLERVAIGPTDRCLSFLPLSHIFERMAGLYAMLDAGATIAYAESMDTVAADAMDVRPTILCGVPRFYEKVYARVLENVRTQPPLRRRLFAWGRDVGLTIARARFAGTTPPLGARLAYALSDRLVGAKVRARVGGKIRYCVSGSAPLAPHVIEFLFAVGIPVIEGYGLTETSPVICLNPPGGERPGSVGTAIAGVEVRIGEEGEILTRGPHVMRGYFHNDEATRAAIRDGWFHTGDIGTLDADGYLTITDRLKDLLVTAGGKKVAPQPIEARLKQCSWVSEAVLIGDRRPFIACLLAPNEIALQQEAKARGWKAGTTAELVARPEVRALCQAEIDRVNAELARFEQIKQWTLLERELTQDSGELTPSLKVKRRVIAEKYGAIIERMYAGHVAAA